MDGATKEVSILPSTLQLSPAWQGGVWKGSCELDRQAHALIAPIPRTISTPCYGKAVRTPRYSFAPAPSCSCKDPSSIRLGIRKFPLKAIRLVLLELLYKSAVTSQSVSLHKVQCAKIDLLQPRGCHLDELRSMCWHIDPQYRNRWLATFTWLAAWRFLPGRDGRQRVLPDRRQCEHPRPSGLVCASCHRCVGLSKSIFKPADFGACTEGWQDSCHSQVLSNNQIGPAGTAPNNAQQFHVVMKEFKDFISTPPRLIAERQVQAPGRWADGLSVACRNTTVSGNTIVGATE